MTERLHFRRLDFDEALFGHPVALLEAPTASPRVLLATLEDLRGSGVRLVYWPCAPSRENDTAAAAAGGFLADRRTTYYRELSGTGVGTWWDEVEAYTEAKCDEALEALAIASAEQSRFRVDPRVPDSVFETLYRRWIANSVSGQIADLTLVIRDEQSIVAMATVAAKNGRSDIGLIAVSEAHRGRSLGTRLIEASHCWAVDRGIHAAQVVTQGANMGARRLYEKCGYAVETVEHYYHFWLDRV